MATDKIRQNLLELRDEILEEYLDRIRTLKKLAKTFGIELDQQFPAPPSLSHGPVSQPQKVIVRREVRSSEPTSLTEAIRQVLRSSGKSMTIPEIIEELPAYIDLENLSHKGPLRNVVSACLSNLKKQVEVFHDKTSATYMDQKAYEEKRKLDGLDLIFDSDEVDFEDDDVAEYEKQ